MTEFKPKVVPLNSMILDDEGNHAEEIEEELFCHKRMCYILNYNSRKWRLNHIVMELENAMYLRAYQMKNDGTLEYFFENNDSSRSLVVFFGELPTTSRRKEILMKKINSILNTLEEREKVLFLLPGRSIFPSTLKKSLKEIVSDIDFISNFTDNIFTELSIYAERFNDFIRGNECADDDYYDEESEIDITNYVLVPDGFYNYALDFAINIGAKLRDELEENQKTIDKLTDERDQLLEKIKELEGKLSKTPDVENSKADSKETEKELYRWTDEEDKQLWNQYQEYGEKAFEDFENIGVDECKNRYYFLKSMVDNGDGDLWIK